MAVAAPVRRESPGNGARSDLPDSSCDLELSKTDLSSRSTRKGGQFQDGVPVTTGAARAELFLDEGVRQLRPANPRRVDHIQMLAVGANALWPLDGSLKRLHVLGLRCCFQEHDHKMARITLRFIRERV